MISHKIQEVEEFRRNKLQAYTDEAQRNMDNFKVLAVNKSTIATKQYNKKKRYKKNTKLNAKNPPIELVNEMLLYGERKMCPLGYIYLEYKNYKSYMHKLVILHNNINIPKGYTIHHIDKNKLNNNLDNLMVLSWEEHRKKHHK